MRTSETVLASTLRLAVRRLSRRMRAERADTSLTLSQRAALATLEVLRRAAQLLDRPADA